MQNYICKIHLTTLCAIVLDILDPDDAGSVRPPGHPQHPHLAPLLAREVKLQHRVQPRLLFPSLAVISCAAYRRLHETLITCKVYVPVTITLWPPPLSGTVTALRPFLADGRGAASTQAELPAVRSSVEERASEPPPPALDHLPPATRYTWGVRRQLHTNNPQFHKLYSPFDCQR